MFFKYCVSHWRRYLSCLILTAFVNASILPPQVSYAQLIPSAQINLPVVGSVINVSEVYAPTLIKGLSVDENDPFKFEFLMDTGDSALEGEALKAESYKMIKYFMASLATPEKDMWVNLSPYEKDRIIPETFGQTEMGRDLLAQDYILKQLTASLMSPEGEVGKKFWERVYEKIYQERNSPQPPLYIKRGSAQRGGVIDPSSDDVLQQAINTFNKVWIVPQTGYFYEHNNSVFIVDAKLKVMLEEDYVAYQKSVEAESYGLDSRDDSFNQLSSPVETGLKPVSTTAFENNSVKQIIRDVIIPVIEQEINEGENFANLRQIYNAMLLSVWFKKRLKDHILGQSYADKEHIQSIALNQPNQIEEIWNKYVEAFQAGAANTIKEEYDPVTQSIIPRKYFTGGAVGEFADFAQLNTEKLEDVAEEWQNGFNTIVSFNSNQAMMSEEEEEEEPDGPREEGPGDFIVHENAMERLSAGIDFNFQAKKEVIKEETGIAIEDMDKEEFEFYVDLYSDDIVNRAAELETQAFQRSKEKFLNRDGEDFDSAQLAKSADRAMMPMSDEEFQKAVWQLHQTFNFSRDGLGDVLAYFKKHKKELPKYLEKMYEVQETSFETEEDFVKWMQAFKKRILRMARQQRRTEEFLFFGSSQLKLTVVLLVIGYFLMENDLPKVAVAASSFAFYVPRGDRKKVASKDSFYLNRLEEEFFSGQLSNADKQRILAEEAEEKGTHKPKTLKKFRRLVNGKAPKMDHVAASYKNLTGERPQVAYIRYIEKMLYLGLFAVLFFVIQGKFGDKEPSGQTVQALFVGDQETKNDLIHQERMHFSRGKRDVILFELMRFLRSRVTMDDEVISQVTRAFMEDSTVQRAIKDGKTIEFRWTSGSAKEKPIVTWDLAELIANQAMMAKPVLEKDFRIDESFFYDGYLEVYVHQDFMRAVLQDSQQMKNFYLLLDAIRLNQDRRDAAVNLTVLTQESDSEDNFQELIKEQKKFVEMGIAGIKLQKVVSVENYLKRKVPEEESIVISDAISGAFGFADIDGQKDAIGEEIRLQRRLVGPGHNEWMRMLVKLISLRKPAEAWYFYIDNGTPEVYLNEREKRVAIEGKKLFLKDWADIDLLPLDKFYLKAESDDQYIFRSGKIALEDNLVEYKEIREAFMLYSDALDVLGYELDGQLTEALESMIRGEAVDVKGYMVLDILADIILELAKNGLVKDQNIYYKEPFEKQKAWEFFVEDLAVGGAIRLYAPDAETAEITIVPVGDRIFIQSSSEEDPVELLQGESKSFQDKDVSIDWHGPIIIIADDPQGEYISESYALEAPLNTEAIIKHNVEALSWFFKPEENSSSIMKYVLVKSYGRVMDISDASKEAYYGDQWVEVTLTDGQFTTDIKDLPQVFLDSLERLKVVDQAMMIDDTFLGNMGFPYSEHNVSVMNRETAAQWRRKMGSYFVELSNKIAEFNQQIDDLKTPDFAWWNEYLMQSDRLDAITQLNSKIVDYKKAREKVQRYRELIQARQKELFEQRLKDDEGDRAMMTQNEKKIILVKWLDNNDETGSRYSKNSYLDVLEALVYQNHGNPEELYGQGGSSETGLTPYEGKTKLSVRDRVNTQYAKLLYQALVDAGIKDQEIKDAGDRFFNESQYYAIQRKFEAAGGGDLLVLISDVINGLEAAAQEYGVNYSDLYGDAEDFVTQQDEDQAMMNEILLNSLILVLVFGGKEIFARWVGPWMYEVNDYEKGRKRVYFNVIFLSPIVEEILFRYMFLNLFLINGLGLHPYFLALPISAIVFGQIHKGGFWSMHTVAGLFLGAIYISILLDGLPGSFYPWIPILSSTAVHMFSNRGEISPQVYRRLREHYYDINQAMMNVNIRDNQTQGGVNLRSDQADIQIQTSENGFKFPKLDPAKFNQSLQNMVPVILDIVPMTKPEVMFRLGLATTPESENDSEISIPGEKAKEMEKVVLN